MVLAPLALLVVLAIAASGTISAGSAVYNYNPFHISPASSYGISDQLLYVANGRASNVKVIDVGTMSIVDTIPVPNQVTPGFLNGLNPGLMNWELHGVVPAQDRKSIYAVGALSGGSYPVGGPVNDSAFRLADYRMYEVNTATKATEREIPLDTYGPANPVGFCGLEYNLNNESSGEIISASMNAANGTLASVLSIAGCTYQNTIPSATCTDILGNANTSYTTDLAKVGTPVPFQIGPLRGSGAGHEEGGWAFEDIASGTNTGFMSTDANSNMESSTCGVSWNADGTRGFAAQMFEPLVTKVNWTNRTADGTIAASTASGTSYHQSASDKAAGLLYVTSSSGNVDVFDMNTNILINSINIRALTNTPGNDVHGVEIAPGHSNILYVTSRNTPTDDNMELVVDITNINAPVLIGGVPGLAKAACGVYADADKSVYYAAANPTPVGNQMLFVANGRASNVKVIDVGSMSIVDTIPVPNQPTPGPIHDWNLGLMNWEIHGVVPSKDRTSVYAVGALSAGSYDPVTGVFRLADYRMYDINTATKATTREIPMQTPGQPVNPVGFCGLEYNLENENSNEIIGASMNASDATLSTVLSDPVTHTPIVLGRPESAQVGGWAFEDIASGTNTGFMSTDANGTIESSTCGVSWNADGTRGFAAQMFEPLVTKVNWTTRIADGTIAASTAPGTSYHQSASDKAAGLLYVASSSGNVDVFDMNTNILINSVNIRALTGTASNDVHGVELAPGNSHIMYVTSRNTPDAGGNMELVVDISNMSAPKLLGSVNGLATAACGVYAISDKAEYYGAKPALTLSRTRTYWASLADYEARKLSVNYSVGNGGTANAANVSIVGSTSTASVTAASALPMPAGNIAAGGSAAITLQYNVPVSTTAFMTSTYATAQNGASVYTYPGPYPSA
ncbi:MAG: YncE family protein [Thermoleophilia bacterium]